MTLKELLTANEKFPHREHQLVGVQQLVLDVDPSRGRVIPGVFGLLDEVGAGKSKQIVDSAHVLFVGCDICKPRTIDTVCVLTPGFARSTWAEEDPTLGEVAKHAWDSVPNIIHEFHGKYTDLDLSADSLHWVVSNYEFVRRDNRRDDLLDQLRGRRVWFVFDESWAIKARSDQTKACAKLRKKRADRVTILNGTPLSDGKPQDLFWQFAVLDPAIIGCTSMAHFRAKYCVMGGFQGRNIIDYQNLDELNKRVAPYILSRKTRDCFDLPPMLPPITVQAALGDDTWKLYREMRDDTVAWFGGQASVSRQAIVRILRLAQITSGYLGGLETLDDEAVPLDLGPVPQWLQGVADAFDVAPVAAAAPPAPVLAPVTKEIGREKLDAFLNWLTTFEPLPQQLLVWCRFRAELERCTAALEAVYPKVYNLKGGQGKDDRLLAKRLLAPGSTEHGAVVGNQKAGGASLNFSAANVAVYMSNSPALIERTQSIGRIERPGAKQPMLIVDVVATGPKGQKTIDHKILKSLRAKDDMARWTVTQWRKILAEE